MKYAILFFSTFLIATLTLAKDLYIFEGSKNFDYTITLDDIEPGHSARQIKNGFLLGKAKNKRAKIDMSKPINEIFKKNIEDNNADSKLLDDSEKVLSGKLDNIEGVNGTISKKDTAKHNIGELKKINWDQVDACAIKNLPLLKKAVYLKSRIDQSKQNKKSYNISQTLYLENASEDGMVCGQLLSDGIPMNIHDEVMNIKILSALLSRNSKREKLYLYETLLAGFAKNAPEESRILFVYFWAKISFMAITQSSPLPSHLKMVQEFKNNPDKVQAEILIEGKSVISETKINYFDLKKQVKQGRHFVKSLGIQYEI